MTVREYCKNTYNDNRPLYYRIMSGRSLVSEFDDSKDVSVEFLLRMRDCKCTVKEEKARSVVTVWFGKTNSAEFCEELAQLKHFC